MTSLFYFSIPVSIKNPENDLRKTKIKVTKIEVFKFLIVSTRKSQDTSYSFDIHLPKI